MFRLLWESLLSRRGETLALIVLTILAAGSATATPLYLEKADRTAIVAELEAASPAERSITTHAATSDGNIAGTAESLRAKLRAAIPWPGLTEVTGGWISGSVTAVTAVTPSAAPAASSLAPSTSPAATAAPAAPTSPAPAAKVDTVLVAREGFCGHVRLEGTCPSAPGEAAISETLAGQLKLKAGDALTYQTFNGDVQIALKVTAVYGEADTVADPFWAGRTVLTPYPKRSANPVFTPTATIAQSKVEAATASADLVAGPGALSEGDLEELAAQVSTNISYGFTPDESRGLRYLLNRIASTRAVLGASLPAGAIQLLLLCWLVLLLTITYGALQRRGEVGITTLRGATFRVRLATSFAPPAVILLLFSPVGFGLGLLVAQAMPTPVAWIAAGATLLAVLITAAIAISRVNAVSLSEALRNVPPRRGGRATLIGEVVAVAIAVMAVVQAVSAGPSVGIGLVAPVAVALVAGLATARLVRGIAGGAGAAALRRGRLSLGLATIQLARRPGADRLVTLIVVAVALAVQAAAAWDVAAKQTQAQAENELGAPTVVTVARTSRTQLLAAVRSIDPEGKWAMAAARDAGAESTLVTVDSSRLIAVTGEHQLAGLVGKLRPPSADSVRVNGSALILTFASNEKFTRPVELTAVLEGPGGQQINGSLVLTPPAVPELKGKAEGKIEIPGCTGEAGCRLAWLKFERSPAGLALTSIGQTGPDRTILTGAAIGAPTRWRTELDYGTSVDLILTLDSVTVSYVPRRPADSPVVRLFVADVPLPVPALASGPEELLHTREVARHNMFGGAPRPVEVLAALPALPGLPAKGIITDFEIADRLGDSFENNAELQVWLGADAPADADARLRAAGLIPLSTETIAGRAAKLDVYGAGPGARLQLAAAIIGLLLLLPAMAVVASADRRARAAELKALRVQGVPQEVIVRATGGYGLLVAVAVPVAAATSLLTWRLTTSAESQPDLVVMAAAFAVAALVLGSAARLAKRQLTRAVGGTS